jgi:glycosyltransferase involved in cell wall biosynthesis
VIFDLDDIEHIAFRRRLTQASNLAERMQSLHLGALLSCERRALRAASMTLVCSALDKQRLHGAPHYVSRVEVLPNSIVMPTQTAARNGGAPTISFVGTFDYRPNVAAALELMHEIFPRVAARVPDAQLRLVGAHPERVLCGSAAPAGVTCTGFVPDIAAEYARASVVCCPIRAGSGTRVKILEAAAYSLPVVSTTLGAEGIDLVPEREVLLADDVDGLADSCVRLLQSPVLARTLGAAARDKVATVHERAAAEAQLRSLIAQELAR